VTSPAPPEGPSPTHSSNRSFFQIGTSALSRSMACLQPSKAAARCGAETAMTTAASPGSSVPTRCTMATRVPGQRDSISPPMLAIARSAIAG
jgi:hypothetical protein